MKLLSLQRVYQNYIDFLSTNHEPGQDKILVSILVVATFALAIFIMSGMLHHLRDINLLKVKRYSIKIGTIWITGAVLLDFILMVTKIANYNVVSFLVVSMVWDNIYQKIFNQANDKGLNSLDTIEG